jgi:hypothetical protein
MFIPNPGSDFFSIPNPVPHQRIFNQKKIISKLSDKSSVIFIPDPGSSGQKSNGSGSLLNNVRGLSLSRSH